VNRYWKISEEALREARVLYEAKLYNGASSRAYYAVFNAARALPSTVESVPEEIKKHASVRRLFSKHFVNTGLFSREAGRFFSKAAVTRTSADYGETLIGADEAKAILGSAEDFVATARTHLKSAKTRA
jgi:uncharacterized protein (UPF0332 family)